MKSGDLCERLGREEPDLPGVLVLDAYQSDFDRIFTNSERADLLAIDREAVIQCAVWRVTDRANGLAEVAIKELAQLARQRFGVRTLLRLDLQVSSRGDIIITMNCPNECRHRASGGVPSE